MKKRTTVIITFIFIITLIAGLYIFTDWFSRVTGYFLGEDEKTKLAHCLSERGAEFYCTKYNPECEAQEMLFGQAIKSINARECGKDKEFCPSVRSLPAWYINKKIHYGLKSIEELKQISGCE